MAAGFGILLILGILLFAFWLWMIIDCARRVFRNTTEKIVWLVVVILGGWIGGLAYLLVIRMNNPHGLANRR